MRETIINQGRELTALLSGLYGLEQMVKAAEPINIIGIMAPDRSELITYLKERISGSYETFLRVEMPTCSSAVEYRDEADVPETSVPCPCGNLRHWVIKYRE